MNIGGQRIGESLTALHEKGVLTNKGNTSPEERKAINAMAIVLYLYKIIFL